MRYLRYVILAALCLLPGLAQAKIFLADTNDTLRVVTASGVTTIHMYAAWADLTTTALTPGNSDAQVTTATTTVLVGAPGASTQRQIKGLSIRNSHASSSNVITVEFFDGATATELIRYTLLAGETLQWGEDENFRVIDASGQVKASVAAAQSGTWNLNNISGTISLPTGAATAALQDGIIKDGTGDTTQANVSGGRLQVENNNPNLAADNSTNGTAKVPVLPCRANASAPTWTEGNQIPCSTTLAGRTRVDGSEVTQPISAASLPLPAGAATAANQDGIIRDGTGDTTQANVSSGNLHTALQTPLPTGSNVIGALTANQSVNMAQINGVAPTMGNGVSGTGVQRVTIASDSTGTVAVTQATAANLNMRPDTSGATGAAPPARASFTGALGSGATGGLVVPVTACDSFANVNVGTATTTLLITGVSGRHVRICSYEITTSAANNIALISGTGATCGTGTTGMTGGTTSGTGHNLAANTGWTRGSGLGEINRTNATGDSVCVITSATAQLSGRIAYAIY